jgi:hypothetical protein
LSTRDLKRRRRHALVDGRGFEDPGEENLLQGDGSIGGDVQPILGLAQEVNHLADTADGSGKIGRVLDVAQVAQNVCSPASFAHVRRT